MNPFRRLLDEINELLDDRADEEPLADSEALQQLRTDVEDHLAAERPADEDPERRSRLVESLTDAEDRFQAQHPRLTQIISQALNAISDAGF